MLAVLVPGCPRAGGTSDPKQAATRLELAKHALSRPNPNLEEAEIEASKALDLDGDNVEAINVLGLINYMRAVNNFRLLEVEDCLTGVDAEALRREMDQFLTHVRSVETRIDRLEAILRLDALDAKHPGPSKLIEPKLRFPLLGHVARDLGEANELAVVILDGVEHDARPKAGAVLANVKALVKGASVGLGAPQFIIMDPRGPVLAVNSRWVPPGRGAIIASRSRGRTQPPSTPSPSRHARPSAATAAAGPKRPACPAEPPSA